MSLDKGGQGSLDEAYTPKAIPATLIIDGGNPAHIITYDSTGQKVRDGTDPNTEFQAALNLNPGLLYIRPCNLTFTAPLIYPGYCRIQGASSNFGASGGTQLNFGFNDFLFKPLLSGGALQYYSQIKDLYIVTTTDLSGQGCILLDGVVFSEVKRVKIGDSSGTKVHQIGIEFTDSLMIGDYFNRIDNCDINNVNTGVLFKVGAGGWMPVSNMIVGGRFLWNVTGINIDSGSNNLLLHPDIENTTTAIRCNRAMYYGNMLIGGFFGGNTTDLLFPAGMGMMTLGQRWDLVRSLGAGSEHSWLGFGTAAMMDGILKAVGTGTIIRCWVAGNAANFNYAIISGTNTQWWGGWQSSTVGQPGVFKNLYVTIDVAPGGVTSRTFTLFKNGADTGLTCTITGAATSASDTTDTVSVATGDTISWEEKTSGAVAACAITSIEAEFVHSQN